MSQIEQRSSGRVRRGMHLGATVAMWVWAPLSGLALLIGLIMVLASDPEATELDALPRLFGLLVVASCPVALVLVVCGLRALRWTSSEAVRRWTTRVAVVVGVIALLVLVTIWTFSARGESGGGMVGAVWVLALWPIVVLPAALITVVALQTHPDRLAAAVFADRSLDLLR